jgi:hypothetical protein
MRTLIMLLAAVICASAQAQQNPAAAPGARPAAAAPSPDQLEPAVDTTAATTPATTPATTRAATPPTGPAPRSDASRKSAPAADSAGGAAKGGARGAKGPDRVELETTEITGNRELPKVLYIVPWKRSDLGDLVGKPPNSLLDDVLQPIDRDVFLRENRYYDAIKPDVVPPQAGAAPGSGGKP